MSFMGKNKADFAPKQEAVKPEPRCTCGNCDCKKNTLKRPPLPKATTGEAKVAVRKDYSKR